MRPRSRPPGSSCTAYGPRRRPRDLRVAEVLRGGGQRRDPRRVGRRAARRPTARRRALRRLQPRVTAASRVTSAVATMRDAWSDGIAVDVWWRWTGGGLDSIGPIAQPPRRGLRAAVHEPPEPVHAHARPHAADHRNQHRTPARAGAPAVAAARRRWAATGCCSSRPPASSSRRSATWPAPPTTIWSGSTRIRVDDGTRARRHSRRGAIDDGTLDAHRHEPGAVRRLLGEIEPPGVPRPGGAGSRHGTGLHCRSPTCRQCSRSCSSSRLVVLVLLLLVGP